MTMRQKGIYLLAGILGFIASYFALIWLFFVSFAFLLLMILSDRPKESTPNNPVHSHRQHQAHQRLTIAGFAFLFGATAAFILKFSILGFG